MSKVKIKNTIVNKKHNIIFSRRFKLFANIEDYLNM